MKEIFERSLSQRVAGFCCFYCFWVLGSRVFGAARIRVQMSWELGSRVFMVFGAFGNQGDGFLELRE